MKKNVGNIDSIIRIIAGLLIVGAGYYFESWWGAVGVVPLLTGFIGWCPAYRIMGISSCGSSACGCSSDKHAHTT